MLRTTGLWAIAPCRIVWVNDEADRFGFAYGTLPGHPECGEAAFSAVRTDAGARFEIVSFSRSVDPLARLVPALSRSIQRRATLRYVDSIVRAASG